MEENTVAKPAVSLRQAAVAVIAAMSLSLSMATLAQAQQAHSGTPPAGTAVKNK